MALPAHQYGRVLLQLGRAEEARRQWLRVLELEPQHLDSMLDLATLAIDSGRAEEATDLLDRALRIAPQDPRVETLRLRLSSSDR